MKNSASIFLTLCLGSLLLLSTAQLTAQDENKSHLLISGQVMTDAGYNFNQVNPDYFDVMRPTQLPAYKNEYGTDGTMFFGVRQSFFRVQSFTSTKYGELMIHFAFDLFGSGVNAGETNFHLLYAWAELGMFGAGRNWSLFSDVDGFPKMLEYWGPVGLSLCKNVQLRFMPLRCKNYLAFALEQPGASADEGVYVDRIELTDVKPKLNIPDFAANFRMTRHWGYAEIAAVLRKIEWVYQGNEPYDLSGKVWGWGFNLSSNLNLNENNVLLLQSVAGKGIQNLMNDAPTDIGIKNDFSNTLRPIKGVALPLYSYSCYLNHRWNDKWTTAAGYSAIHTQNSDGQQPEAFRNGRYASANLLYTPLTNIMAGIELQWINCENHSDSWTTSATKVQLSFRYRFSQRL
ncbi:DcaP family trimeric outer membrane transporter [Draconibacterium sp. IB214405]|uniref:DcaP family trimeric outer membrane transporter n=1 Tax=Draconibacterium sp. IB214405 TaxID=3097352 RepID=UPI002A14DEBF|nr:DcaP family trimeric outer membrane transporter [Draconibacterium sp. IB214405]MDX8337863.1 DcaP family trimeric outer membrane transporter [Draconibacterium sp. IB214405]